MPLSPLVRLTLTGIAAGLAIGLFVALTPSTPSALDLVGAAGQSFLETRTRMRWNLTKVPNKYDQTKFDYEVTESEFAYTVSAPVVGVHDVDIPLWQEMIGRDIAAGEFANALSFLTGLRDCEDRSDALSYVISQISSKPLPFYANEQFAPVAPTAPYFASPPATDSLISDDSIAEEERAAKRQKELVKFVQETSQEVDAAIGIADTVDDYGSRAMILMKLSSIQFALGNDEIAKKTSQTAKAAFAEFETERHGVWARVKKAFVTLIGWAGTIGLGTFFSGLLIKVFGHYFIETAAYKIGDEKFAKALGTSLRTTAKESGLILLPEHLKHENNE